MVIAEATYPRIYPAFYLTILGILQDELLGKCINN